MSDHSTIGLGGSSCERVINCPPSRMLAKDIPVEETVFMRNGTLLHNAMETYITTGTAPPVPEELQEKLEHGIKLWDAIVSDPLFVRVHVEQRVHFPQIPGAFGTADLIIEWSDNSITIGDWKFGDGHLVSADTPQLKFYAAAAMVDPGTKHLFKPDTTVHLTILQPIERGEPVRTAHTDIIGLAEFLMALKKAYQHGEDGTGEFKVGDHCKFCPYKAKCPALDEAQQKLMEWENPLELTPVMLSQALEILPAVEQRIKAIRATVHDALDHGTQIPGWKLVAKSANRSWVDEDKAAALAEKAGVDPYVQKIKSPAQLEKECEVPESLYEKKPSGTTLVRESDRRPAVSSAKQMGAAVDRLKALLT